MKHGFVKMPTGQVPTEPGQNGCLLPTNKSFIQESSWDKKSEPALCREKSRSLGKWFAETGSTTRVFEVVGNQAVIMQIKSIILYNQSSQKREISFKLNQVNIIRVRMIPVNRQLFRLWYFLGRSDFVVSGKVTRDTVAWYSVLYQIQNRQLFVAKPKPAGSDTRFSQVYYRIGEIDEELSPPDELPGSLQKASDTELIETISGLLEGLLDPDAIDQSRLESPTDTQVDKASYYLFQNQHTIAHPEQLFHRQGEAEVSKTIKKTLPYFLGVDQEENLQTKRELAQAESQLRQISREVNEIEAKAIELVRIGRD